MPETNSVPYVKPRDVILQTNRCKTQEFVRNYWVATVEPHITREDLMNPEFWANLSFQFKQYDRIEVGSDDCQFFAEYLVLSADKTSAYLKELRWLDLSKKPVVKDAKFKVQWRGRHAKWSVVNIKTKSILKEDLAAKLDAEKWLANYLETI